MERDIEQEQSRGGAPFDPLAEEQAAAAAQEAGAIGGSAGDAEAADPELRAVLEGGGGEAEGFEQAEEALVSNAGHGEGGLALEGGFSAEAESDLSTAAYGEADEVEATEVTRDPEAGSDDPGAGPGLAAER